MANSRTSSPDQAATRERDELPATKLNIPRTRPDHLGRSRLIERLNQGMARELTVVCTPAGFGKTTLLAGWAAGASLPVAWLTLEPEDNDPVRFWRCVVAALDRVADGLGEQLLPLLRPSGVVSDQGVVTALVNRLAAVPDELVLVLDDYHLVSSRQVHEDMALLLGHLPPQLHVVITSRSDPPLPLARLRARGSWWSCAPPTYGSPLRSRRRCWGRCGGWTWRRRPWPRFGGDLAEQLGKLKQQPGKTISITGSATLVRWLLRAGLLDELGLMVCPIVVGHGKRLFQDWGDELPLRLVAANTFSTGVLSLTYAPATGGGPASRVP
jgi:riboflavin biosynthesis pyrimidine reductase